MALAAAAAEAAMKAQQAAALAANQASQAQVYTYTHTSIRSGACTRTHARTHARTYPLTLSHATHYTHIHTTGVHSDVSVTVSCAVTGRDIEFGMVGFGVHTLASDIVYHFKQFVWCASK